MERQELELMLRRVDGEVVTVRRELTALQDRLDGLTTLAQGLRKLLGLPPAAGEPLTPTPASAAAMNGHTAAGSSDEPPIGMDAVRQILVSGPAQSWSVRQAWDESKKRGWPLSRDAVRIAFVRLYDHEPENIERTKDPVTSYRWRGEIPAGS